MADPNEYPKKSLIKVSAIFKDDNGADADPTTVTLIVIDPAGLKTSYVYLTDVEVVRDSLGHFHAAFSADLEGRYFYRWEGEGAVQAAGEWVYQIVDSKFYAS